MTWPKFRRSQSWCVFWPPGSGVQSDAVLKGSKAWRNAEEQRKVFWQRPSWSHYGFADAERCRVRVEEGGLAFLFPTPPLLLSLLSFFSSGLLPAGSDSESVSHLRGPIPVPQPSQPCTHVFFTFSSLPSVRSSPPPSPPYTFRLLFFRFARADQHAGFGERQTVLDFYLLKVKITYKITNFYKTSPANLKCLWEEISCKANNCPMSAFLQAEAASVPSCNTTVSLGAQMFILQQTSASRVRCGSAADLLGGRSVHVDICRDQHKAWLRLSTFTQFII